MINHLGPVGWNLLCEAFGGSRISIPTKESGVAWKRLVDAVGEDYARSAVRWAGGELVAFPKARYQRIQETVEQLLDDGVTVKEIADLTFPTKVTARHIRRIDAARRAAKGI